MLTEETIRELPAGRELRMLCAVAMGATVDTFLRDLKARGMLLAYDLPDVAGDWAAAGPALQWLAKRDPSIALRPLRGLWCITMGSIVPWLSTSVITDTPQLAIARAVALVGLSKSPAEMQAAWASTQGGE